MSYRLFLLATYTDCSCSLDVSVSYISLFLDFSIL